MQTWQTYLEENCERFLNELKDFLRIPSISALPEHASDVQEAAKWVADRMSAAGIENIEVLPTDGHPVVYGDWLHVPGAPTVLIYGHFDTQPVDPLELWTNPPFEPTVQEGRIYARGASDNKGNMLTPILAFEALLQTESSLPVNVKFFFEGQEEIGSPQLPALVAQQREKLACDMVFSVDTGQWSEDRPLPAAELERAVRRANRCTGIKCRPAFRPGWWDAAEPGACPGATHRQHARPGWAHPGGWFLR